MVEICFLTFNTFLIFKFLYCIWFWYVLKTVSHWEFWLKFVSSACFYLHSLLLKNTIDDTDHMHIFSIILPFLNLAPMPPMFSALCPQDEELYLTKLFQQYFPCVDFSYFSSIFIFLLIFDRCVFHKKTRKKSRSKMDVWPLPKLMEYHRCLWPHKTLQFSTGRGPYKQWQKVLPISGGHNFAAFCYARIMLWPSAAGLMTPHPHIGWIICLLEVRVEYFRSSPTPTIPQILLRLA